MIARSNSDCVPESARCKASSWTARAGLLKGDRVLTVGRQQVGRWDELSQMIRQGGEQPVVLTLKRGEQVLKVEVTPQRMETPDIFGSPTQAVLIGISNSDNMAVEKVGPVQALTEGTMYTWRLAYLTVYSLYKLVAREVPLKSLGGPILIAQVAGHQAKLGVAPLVQFMAVLSVNLFLLNLLPIPILDGGHLMFFTLEALRGKPVDIKHREMAQGVGLMLILALMITPFITSVMIDVFDVVPRALKEGGYGIGATTWEVMIDIVVPYTRVAIFGGIMLGLGETKAEVGAVMRDLADRKVDILTLGQYLQPSKQHLPIDRYVPLEEFAELKQIGLELGFRWVESGPLVRSSYNADRQARALAPNAAV